MALCRVLATPGLSLTKSPGPSECTSRRTIAECPGVVGKWQKEAQELRAGRWSWRDLTGLHLWAGTAQADGQHSVPRAHRHYGGSDESLQCLGSVEASPESACDTRNRDTSWSDWTRVGNRTVVAPPSYIYCSWTSSSTCKAILTPPSSLKVAEPLGAFSRTSCLIFHLYEDLHH